MAGVNLAKQLRALDVGGADPSGGSEELSSKLKLFGGGGGEDAGEATIGDYEKKRLVLLLAGAAIVYFSPALLDSFTKSQEDAVKAQIAKVDQDIAKVHATMPDIDRLSKENQETDRQIGELKRKLTLIQNTGTQRNVPIRIMDLVSSEMPEGVWLEKSTITGRDVDLTGKANSLDAVGEFMKRLEGAVFFPKWELEEIGAEGAGDTVADTKHFHIKAKVVVPE